MKQKKTTINIGDLARFCMKSIAEFPMLERQIRYIYINALEDIENGKTEDNTCQNAIIYIEGEIQDML
jgi:hypothetical protein